MEKQADVEFFYTFAFHEILTMSAQHAHHTLPPAFAPNPPTENATVGSRPLPPSLQPPHPRCFPISTRIMSPENSKRRGAIGSRCGAVNQRSSSTSRLFILSATRRAFPSFSQR